MNPKMGDQKISWVSLFLSRNFSVNRSCQLFRHEPDALARDRASVNPLANASGYIARFAEENHPICLIGEAGSLFLGAGSQPLSMLAPSSMRPRPRSRRWKGEQVPMSIVLRRRAVWRTNIARHRVTTTQYHRVDETFWNLVLFLPD